MSLLEQHLGPGGRCQCRHTHDRSSLLIFLSQRGVVEAMAQNPRPSPGRATRGDFGTTGNTKSITWPTW
jgi:hypothetical protein